jgi:serine/threonine-protein kinase
MKDSAVAMLLDEARLAARIRHIHVVPVIDVLEEQGEISLVMEYVHGIALSKLFRRADAMETLTPRIAVGLVNQILLGLHAAHETRDEHGSGGEPRDHAPRRRRSASNR